MPPRNRRSGNNVCSRRRRCHGLCRYGLRHDGRDVWRHRRRGVILHASIGVPMTILNAWISPDGRRALVAGDSEAVATAGGAIMRGITKQIPLPAIDAVIGYSGMMGFFSLLCVGLFTRALSFDELLDQLPALGATALSDFKGWQRDGIVPADAPVHLRWVDRFLGGLALDQVNRDLLDRVRQARKAEGAKNAMVNRTMEVVRAVLRMAAHEWEWLDRAPKVRMLPEPKRRIRWLTRDETDRLLVALPEHLAAMVRFSLETGLRRSNVTGLQWSQVDLARRTAWIHPDQAKARRAIAVPLSVAAVIVIREQVGKHQTHVFSYRGQPVRQVNTKAWREALARVGITDFRWHDLRHTWASWHVQSGTPLHVLQELGGWECVEMVRKYAHFSSAHLADYVDRMSGLRVAGGTEATIQLRAQQ